MMGITVMTVMMDRIITNYNSGNMNSSKRNSMEERGTYPELSK